MNILSFTYWPNCHDTSAALVCDGVLVAAAEEERFSRQKHDSNLPLRAIDFCLQRAGMSMSQIDLIAFPGKPFRSGCDSQLANTDLALLKRLNTSGTIRYRSLLHKRALDVSFRLGLRFNWQMDRTVSAGFAGLRERYSRIPPVRFYDHHLCHASAAYLTSGCDRAAIATIDGRGDSYATVTWDAVGRHIVRLRAEPFTNSLGFFFRDCTRYIGLGDFGEGKTMGLAGYGEKEAYSKRISLMLNTIDSDWYQYLRTPNTKLLGFNPRDTECITSYPYPDFAAASQAALEGAVQRIARSALDAVGSRPLCLGGGVALNCSSNGSLRDLRVAPSIWIFPASGDAGLSVGAALLSASEMGEHRQTQIKTVYLGPEFSIAEYENALVSESRIFYRRVPDIASEAAKCLSSGQVIGWFQGRMELGPRALGNRSIVADPRTVAMRDRVNQIKGREQWRPLAPVVLAERASEYFNLSAASPFMLFATQAQPCKRKLFPSVVHVDGSTRPQTVTRDQNSALYDLISEFDKLTGIPILLNTSFNTAGEPIVCTPEDAIKTFLATRLDLLVLGDFIVRRRDQKDPRVSPEI